MSAFRRILMLISALAMSIPALAPTPGAGRSPAASKPPRMPITSDLICARCGTSGWSNARPPVSTTCNARPLPTTSTLAGAFSSPTTTPSIPLSARSRAGWSAAASRIWGAAPDLSFVPASLLDEARAYRDRTIARNSNAGGGASQYIALAKSASVRGDMDGVIRFYAMAAAADPAQSLLWRELSRGSLAYATQDANMIRSLRSVAISAAINAYQTSRTASGRADSLAVLGEALERAENLAPGAVGLPGKPGDRRSAGAAGGL